MNLTDSTTFNVATAPRRDSARWNQGTVTWGEILSWMEQPADKKECGNYLLGTLKGNKRNKTSIMSRDALTLDVDAPEAGILDDLELLGYTVLYHTTYKSTPDVPRYRLIIPLDRSVAPDEYYVAAAAVMQALGEEQFDSGSVEAERYMFKPSQSAPGRFTWNIVGKGVAVADDLLGDFQQDLSGLPTPKPHKNKRNPYELAGTVGAFNRAYENLDELIAAYDLPYENDGADRYRLVGAAAAAGMGPVQGTVGLYYSHHANDPAGGQTCSAFDLVRLHLYGDLDTADELKKPVNRRASQAAMEETATKDAKVLRDLLGSDFDDLEDIADDITDDDDDSWKMRLNLNARTGKPTDEIFNWDLISNHDKAFKVLSYNELSLAIEITGDLPWRKFTPGREVFSGPDRAEMLFHIEREYGIRPAVQYLDGLVNAKAQRNRRNPVREYLDTLKWDGTARLDECLPGVRPTSYTRLVARKSMTAAVARMMDPGCKWDHMLVLYGTEGLGKSFWVDRMARGFSVALGRIGDKDTLISMQRAWIVTSDEGHTMKKADQEAQKEFITQRYDTFRAPYERESQTHPRHCVIWGTTNDDVFLRKQEGNRRFLIVRCEERVDFDMLTDEYVDQVWAEALHYYRAGESLFLSEDQNELAALEREGFTEETPLVGMVERYLNTLVPMEWDKMTPQNRQMWILNQDSDFGGDGVDPINIVCTQQLYTEALGRPYGEHKPVELRHLAQAMKEIDGWRVLPGKHHVPGYGTQQVYERSNPTHADIDDLI